MIWRGKIDEKRLDHNDGRGKANEMAAGMSPMDQGMQQITGLTILLDAVLVRLVTVTKVGVGRRCLDRLNSVANGRKHGIAHHCEQQHDHRRKAQVTAEMAQDGSHGAQS